MITELVALAIARAGSGDSAAAMVAISAPVMEKITTTIAAKIAPFPSGKNPPCAYRLLKSMLLWGHTPRMKQVPKPMKTMMAATLIPANQNSNSPNDDTENKLVKVISDIRISEKTHNGTPGNQNWMTFAPATASKPTMITQKYQYSQPTEKP